MSIFGSRIDYSGNPIMTELLDNIAREKVKSFALSTDFLLTNLKVYPDESCNGEKLSYAARGYKPLTFKQVMELDKQLVKAIKKLPNVQKVWANPSARCHRITKKDQYGKIETIRVYIYRANFITFRTEKADDGLKSW